MDYLINIYFQDALTALADKVEASGRLSLGNLKTISDNIKQFDTNTQTSGSKSAAELKIIGDKIQTLDANSQQSLVNLDTGLTSNKVVIKAAVDGISEKIQNSATSVIGIAENIKSFDGSSNTALGSLSSGIQTAITDLASSSTAVLEAISSELETAGTASENELTNIVSKLQAIEQHGLSSLVTIGSNIAKNTANSKTAIDSVASGIDSTGHETQEKLSEIVTKLKTLDSTAKAKLAAIKASIDTNLQAVDSSVQANKVALKDFDVNTKASLGNDDITIF